MAAFIRVTFEEHGEIKTAFVNVETIRFIRRP
jgi:hypothetical protein